MWYSVALWLASISTAEGKGKSCAPPELPRFSKAITHIQDSYAQDSYFYYKCDDGYHFESNTNHHKIVCDNTHWQPINLWRCYDACNNACGNHGTCVKTLGKKSTEETSTICQCDKNYAGKHCDARVCESEPIGPHHLQPQLEVGTKPVNGKYPLGALIHYRCENDYVIKSGRTTAHCEADGWVPSQVPICEVSTCSSKKFESGMFSPMLPSYRPGDVVTFSCYDGFVLIGEKKAVCRNGFWSRDWPHCVRSCKRQPFQNGQLSPVQNYYRPTEPIHFQCNEGYQLNGSPQLICQEQGGWSSIWPNCEPIKYCSNPPRVKNAILHSLHSTYRVESFVTYECLKRFVMNKRDGRIYCSYGDDGQPEWDQPPLCTTACRRGERMIRKQGTRDKFYCESKPIITTTVTSSVKPLTIVTATAGALLLLLLIVISLVAYQRRRIALTSRRQGRERLTNEDDRYSFVYYSNDVHVVLPSYDEAMRVQGAPPPYNVDATTGAVTTTNSGSSGGVEASSQETGRREQEATLSSLPSSMEVIYDAIDDLAVPCYNTTQQQNELIQATSASTSGLSTNNNSHKETGNESVRKSIRNSRDNNNQTTNSGDNSIRDTHGIENSSARETHHSGDNEGFIVNNGETNLTSAIGENSNFQNDDDVDYISIGSGSGYSDTDQLIGD